MSSTSDKQALRKHLLAVRRQLPDREQLSGRIFEHLQNFAPYQAAQTLLFYVDLRSEVQTRSALQAFLQETPAERCRLVVPFCLGEELRLVRLHRFEELHPGAYGILEPSTPLREDAQRAVAPDEVDVALIPGVGFDRQGGRIGYGRGYYDRLLAQLRPDAVTIGLTYDCQIVDQLPMEPHDMRLTHLVSEFGLHCSQQLST